MRELPPTTHCGWIAATARLAGLAITLAGTIVPISGAPGSSVPTPLPLTLRSTTTVTALAPLSPVIIERLVILATAEGSVEARPLDAPSATSWTQQIKATGMAAGDGLVYVATTQGVTALNASDGTRRWSAAVDTSAVSLVWQTGLVIASSPKGDLVALKTVDGVQAWHASLGAPLAAAPSADANLVVASLTDRRVVAVSSTDGSTRWTRPLPVPPGGLHVDDSRVFVACDEGSVYALSAKGGQIDWHQNKIGGRAAGAPVTDARAVFVVTVDGVLTVYDKNGGSIEWKNAEKAESRAGALASGGLVFVQFQSGDVQGFLVGAGRPASVAHLSGPHSEDPGALMTAPAVLAGSGETLRLVTITDSTTRGSSMRIYGKARLSATPLTTLPGRPLTPGGPPSRP